jgi:CAAX prenyl protease-like protein
MDNRPGLARTIPFALFVGMMALDPVFQRILPAQFDPRWLYGLRISMVVLALGVLWRFYDELRAFRRLARRDWITGLGVGAVIFVLWINLDFPPLTLGTGAGFDPRTGDGLALGLVATRLTGAALVVPIMEELFWRSFILRWLQNPHFLSVKPGSVGIRPLLFSSVLFATEHHLWFAGILAGLGYGWVYKRSGNLWVPVLAHAVTNGLLGTYVLLTGEWSFW